jgi:hypothetical protein
MEQQARNGNVRYVRCYCEVENLYYKGCRLKVFLQLKKFLRDAATHKDERKERSKVRICSIFRARRFEDGLLWCISKVLVIVQPAAIFQQRNRCYSAFRARLRVTCVMSLSCLMQISTSAPAFEKLDLYLPIVALCPLSNNILRETMLTSLSSGISTA